MKFIVVNSNHDSSRSLSISPWTLAVLAVSLLCLPFAVGYCIAKLNKSETPLAAEQATLFAIKEQVARDKALLQSTRQKASKQLEILTIKMAELQARVLRLDALGEQMATVAGLDAAEFNFSQVPAVGGPLVDDVLIPVNPVLEEPVNADSALIKEIDHLAKVMELRAQQLDTLKEVLATKHLKSSKQIAGRPITNGWLSSKYGMRTDPFNGKKTMHKGVDFAGKLGSPVVAVGSGIVTWSGDMYGYGKMVEVSHGAGIVTRYAHNQENLVKVGDLVKQEQVIAKMGSSGRSTGPHVHFEVFKHGRAIDPASYINRTRR